MADSEPSDPLLLPISSQPIAPELHGKSPTVQKFYVSLPHLSALEKKEYGDMPEEGYMSEPEIYVDEIVGEFQNHNKGLLYFARCSGELLHGYPAKVLRKQHSHLIESYEYKKKQGLVSEKFDPSGKDVDPSSRIRIRLTVNKKRTGAKVMYSSASESAFRGSDESSESELIEDDNDDYSTRRNVRRNTRRGPHNQPPFSPKKTRSRRVLPVSSDDSQDETDSSFSRHPTRRSARTQKGFKVNYEDGSEGYQTQDSDYQTRRKTKKKKYSKVARPAYGHFRSMDDIGYDSDEKTSALRAHRQICEKCHRTSATDLLEVALRNAKRGKKKRRADVEEGEEEESEDEVERAKSLGGWVQCLKCPVAAHWQCLASTQRHEILKATQSRDREEWLKTRKGEDVDVTKDGPPKRSGLEYNQTTEFICGSCMKGGICMGCEKIALEPDSTLTIGPSEDTPVATAEDSTIKDEDTVKATSPESDEPPQLLFRCLTCKRLAHYSHLALPGTQDVLKTAKRLQQQWLCNDCLSYHWSLDKILAWRPYPQDVVEPSRTDGEPVNYKASLPREYLVKWVDRGYRRTTWVPHMWLVSTSASKLKNFLATGSKVEIFNGALVGQEIFEDQPSNIFDDSDIQELSTKNKDTPGPPSAMRDAKEKIPLEWQTVDRVLYVLLRRPHPSTRTIRKKGRRGRKRIESDIDSEENDGLDEEAERVYKEASDKGEPPDDVFTETISEFEARLGRTFGDEPEDIDRVVWAFMKWVDLGYDEATWDTPPNRSDPTFPAFVTAFHRFIAAQTVKVTKYGKKTVTALDERSKGEYRRSMAIEDATQIDLGQDPKLKLMPFQVDGFNWLLDNWWNKQPCILADDMGLGKTVQVSSFIGRAIGEFKAQPALVVVPNSTITNWVREFERWAPRLRVVPFYGEAKSREIIKKFELFHETVEAGTTGAKFHVLVTTFEAVINPKDFTPIFKAQPRWEILIVDEGQRLKSDSSLLFRKLNELNTLQRVIMTGTPLNNNIRELFNLMNFLDPTEWEDLEALEKQYEELDEDLIKQLHGRLRPYFLRRIKGDVLDLPPKNEVIVPVSMTKLQKEVYRSILSRNLELLAGLTKPGSHVHGAVRKSKITNMLMELRKCLQHPYLCDDAIEPTGLSTRETHEKLIDASAKLRLLKSLLPKLKSRGHRVLLFSQFVLALNIVEDFLVGEGYKFLRLDGNTPGFKRQKDMDEFNREGSDIFIYILTTRAGGVGINLYTADTVIIYDPDFNPHQDLQAIARSHRFGQTKTCLVFKLVVKESAEERIMQVGKKKLALDHLIVQNINDEESAGENVQSILMYGAQELFESDESSSKDIIYTDNDIESLIQRTEMEGDANESSKEGSGAFSFAKIWTADKDELEEVGDNDQAQGDSWAQTLQKINAEREKVKIQGEALLGRGVRRKAAMHRPQNVYVEDTPVKKGKKNRSRTTSDGESAYQGSIDSEDADSDSQPGDAGLDPNDLQNLSGKRQDALLTVIHNKMVRVSHPICGLCDQRHREGECSMTESSENLAEYREMLILHADDEPWETRITAVQIIDEILYKRGHLHLITGQPLHPVKAPQPVVKVIKLPKPNPSNSNRWISSNPNPPYNPNPSYNRNPPFNSNTPSGVSKPLGSSIQSSKPAAPQPVSVMTGATTAQPAKSAAPTAIRFVSGPSARARPVAGLSHAMSGHVPSLPQVSTINSKRPPSPNSLIPPSKKVKRDEDTCAVCMGPLHNLGECPVIAQGPERVSKEILRFEQAGVPRMSNVLRSIYAKQMEYGTRTINDQRSHK